MNQAHVENVMMACVKAIEALPNDTSNNEIINALAVLISQKISKHPDARARRRVTKECCKHIRDCVPIYRAKHQQAGIADDAVKFVEI